jgi:hypothetical protein
MCSSGFECCRIRYGLEFQNNVSNLDESKSSKCLKSPRREGGGKVAPTSTPETEVALLRRRYVIISVSSWWL